MGYTVGQLALFTITIGKLRFKSHINLYNGFIPFQHALTDLRPYTEYAVTVKACTFGCARKKAAIAFTTDVGGMYPRSVI